MVTSKAPFPVQPSFQQGPSPANETPSNAAPTGAPVSPFQRPGGEDDFVIDLNGVDLDGGRVYVPVGTYEGYIARLEKTTSKAGNPMIVWYVSIRGGAHNGKTLRLYTALTPDAMWKLVESCDAVGFKFPEDNRFKFGELKAHAARVLVLMDIQERTDRDNGETQLASIARRGPEIERIPDPTKPS